MTAPKLSLDDAAEIAKVCAHKFGSSHGYIREAGLEFEPHYWVVEAVRAGYAWGLIQARIGDGE